MRSMVSWHRTVAAGVAGLAFAAAAAVGTTVAATASGVDAVSTHSVQVVAGSASVDGLKW